MFGRRKARAPQLPQVPERLSKKQLQGLLNGPNGRSLLHEFRNGEVERARGFESKIREAEQYLEFVRKLKANADAMVSDIGDLLAEVEA